MNWAFEARDLEAYQWLEISDWAFWLRYPEALGPQSDRLVNEATLFRRLGEELYVLEYDLTSVLFVFKRAYQIDYQGGRHLSLKKFEIVYHIDNFHVRAHKTIESVEALLALLGGVDPKRRPKKDEPSRRTQMEDALKKGGRTVILRLFRQFREDHLMKRAVEARNRFVHLYRDEPDEWRSAMVTPAARIREYDQGSDSLAQELRRLTEPEHLDSYADEQANRLRETLHVIRAFRSELWEVLLHDAAELVRTQPSETQQRYGSVIVQEEHQRDLKKIFSDQE